MKSEWLIIAAALLCTTLSCSSNKSNPAAPPNTGTIQGHVRADGTNESLEGVVIAVGSRHDTTSVAGLFQLMEVPYGDVSLTALKPGYLDFQVTFNFARPETTVYISLFARGK
jgi:hypothetical protein